LANGSKMVSMAEGGEVYAWNVETKKYENEIKPYADATRICVASQDSKYIVVGGNNGGQNIPIVYETDTLGAPIAYFTGHTHFLQACAISPDSEICLTSQLTQLGDSFFAWNLKTGELVKNLSNLGHQAGATINTIEFSNDGSYFVTAGRDGKIVVWDRSKLSPVNTVNAHPSAINVCRLFGSPPHLLALSEDQTCSVRSVDNPATTLVSITDHDAPVTAGDIDSSHTLAVTASSDGIVVVWNLKDGSVLGRLKGHTNPAESVVFFPNSKFVATSSTDKTIRVWNAEQASQVAIFPTSSFCPTISVCPSGTKLFAGDSAGHVYMFSFHEIF